MVKIGIIGAGWAGSLHAASLKEVTRADLVAVADCEIDKAKYFAHKFGLKHVFQDYREMLNCNIVDAVYISTPSASHAEQVLYAIGKGKDVFCEKPPTITLEQIEQIVREVERTGQRYQVGFNRRFCPAYKKVKEYIESGRFKPFSVDIKMVDGTIRGWVKVKEIVGSYLHDSLIHVFDLYRYFFGDIISVRALSRRNLYPIDDEWCIILESDRGVIGTITYSAHATFLYPVERYEIYGGHACIVTEEVNRVILSEGEEDVPETESCEYYNYFLPLHVKFGFKEEDERFVNAVENKKETPVNVYDALKAMRVIEACFKSSKEDAKAVEPY